VVTGGWPSGGFCSCEQLPQHCRQHGAAGTHGCRRGGSGRRLCFRRTFAVGPSEARSPGSAAWPSASSQHGGGPLRAGSTGGTAAGLSPARRLPGGGWRWRDTGASGVRPSPSRRPGAAGPAAGWPRASARPSRCSGMRAAGPSDSKSHTRYMGM
jgi:hypothetical protein